MTDFNTELPAQPWRQSAQATLDDYPCPCGCRGDSESHNEWVWGPFVCPRCLRDSDRGYLPCEDCRLAYELEDQTGVYHNPARPEPYPEGAPWTDERKRTTGQLHDALLGLVTDIDDVPSFAAAWTRWRELRTATATATWDGKDLIRDCAVLGELWALWSVRVDAAMEKAGGDPRKYPARIVLLCLQDKVRRGAL